MNRAVFFDRDDTIMVNVPYPVSYTHLDVYKRQDWKSTVS